jgi:hypothetical protein
MCKDVANEHPATSIENLHYEPELVPANVEDSLATADEIDRWKVRPDLMQSFVLVGPHEGFPDAQRPISGRVQPGEVPETGLSDDVRASVLPKW